ncbi:hypothetical protein [Blastopirellula marina]|uniref:Uncharacterized protein n=1 Tax=Blastopirellula marina DSM 3645 TaxID=314230 RepID=A3ZXS6_9BACT|nr:hypothetical protein [Blastopirellula marina]EAQ78655.1 hypothetical protein DSM3645_07680 [Blastopirellula marina DSM 3645]
MDDVNNAESNPFASPVANAHVATTPRGELVDWYALPVRRSMLVGGVVGGLLFLAFVSPGMYVVSRIGVVDEPWASILHFLVGVAAGMMVGVIAGNIVGFVAIFVRRTSWRTVAHLLASGLVCPVVFVGSFLVLAGPVREMTPLAYIGFSCVMLLVGLGAGIYSFRGLLRLSTEGSPRRRLQKEPTF